MIKYEYARQWFRPECETEQHAYIEVREAEGYALLTSYVYQEKLWLVMRKPIENSDKAKRELIRNNPESIFAFVINGERYVKRLVCRLDGDVDFSGGVVSLDLIKDLRLVG